MDADCDHAGLRRGRQRQRVVKIPRVEGVDGDRGQLGAVFARNRQGLLRQRGVFVGRRVGLGQIIFAHDSHEVAGNRAALLQTAQQLRLGLAGVAVVMQQLDQHPVARLHAVGQRRIAIAGDQRDECRQLAPQGPHPVTVVRHTEAADNLLVATLKNLGDFANRPTRVVVGRNAHHHAIAAERTLIAPGGDEDVLVVVAVLIDKAEALGGHLNDARNQHLVLTRRGWRSAAFLAAWGRALRARRLPTAFDGRGPGLFWQSQAPTASGEHRAVGEHGLGHLAELCFVHLPQLLPQCRLAQATAVVGAQQTNDFLAHFGISGHAFVLLL